MPFEIGDRVEFNSEADSHDIYSVGRDNIGTVIRVVEYEEYCEINWDNPGRNTYQRRAGYPNQWNVGLKYLQLAETENQDKLHPNYKVILKVKSMDKKRKALGYAI